MFTKEKLEKYLERCLKTGADYAELFIEKSNNTNYSYIDSKVDDISSVYDYGMGIRIALGNDIVYGAINKLEDEVILNKIDELTKYFNKVVSCEVNLKEEEIPLINENI